eukprot:scaffold3043_cov180-Amphora_coffeaeformis.AAC.16
MSSKKMIVGNVQMSAPEPPRYGHHIRRGWRACALLYYHGTPSTQQQHATHASKVCWDPVRAWSPEYDLTAPKPNALARCSRTATRSTDEDAVHTI